MSTAIASRPTIVAWPTDRKSTRLNSSHTVISYAVFCLKKKNSQLVNIGVYHNEIVITRQNIFAITDGLQVGAGIRRRGIDRRQHVVVFFFNDTATTEIYTLSLHDALPI